MQNQFSNGKIATKPWPEQYISSQIMSQLILDGKISTIRRNAVVSDSRDLDTGAQLCSQSWRPKLTKNDFGSAIDILSLQNSATAWLASSAVATNMIFTQNLMPDADPLKAALYNLIQACARNSQIKLMDCRVGENINFAKAIRDELGSEIAVCDLRFWGLIADMFCDCLLPDLALEKTIRESNLPAKPKTSKFLGKKIVKEKVKDLRKFKTSGKVDETKSRLQKQQENKLSEMVNFVYMGVEKIWEDFIEGLVYSLFNILYDNFLYDELEKSLDN